MIRTPKPAVWAGLTGLLIVVFNLVLFTALERQHRAVHVNAEHLVQSTANLVEFAVSQYIESSERTLSGLAQLITTTQAMQGPINAEVVAAMVERRHVSPALLAILAFDAKGNLRLHSEKPGFHSANVADRPYFRDHRNTTGSRPYLGPPLRNRSNGAWVVPLTCRLENKDGSFSGVILSGLLPEHFVDIFKNMSEEDGLIIILRHRNGAVIATQPSLISDDAIAAPDYDSNAPTAQRQSQRYPLQIEVAVDMHKRLADWQREKLSTILLALTGSTVIALAGWALYWQRLRRGQAMCRLAETNALLEQRVEERTTCLKNTAERLSSILAVAQDAIIVIDAHGKIIEYNPAAAALFGYRADEIVGESINRLMPQRYASTHDYHVRRPRSQSSHIVGKGREMTGLHKSGREFPIELSVGSHHDSQGDQVHVGVIRDISERKQVEAALTKLANTDALTGLLNRRAFLEEGRALIADSDGRQLAVLMIDADHFKGINDNWGHAVGDEVLGQLARILESRARSHDVVGRLGGEEFALVLAQAPGDAATRVADSIQNQIRQTKITLSDGAELGFRVSIGIAIGTDHDTLEELLSLADQALYDAKTRGRDRWVEVRSDSAQAA